MALQSSTQELVNDLVEENTQLGVLAANTSKPSTKLEDTEFYKKLPAKVRSVFYGFEHYKQYRNVTLTKLNTVLVSSEFDFNFLNSPFLIYSSALAAILYVINIQFKNDQDMILHQRVTDRQE
jgi:hypothetical protein